MTRPMRAFVIAGLAMLLGACAGQPTRTAAPLSPQEQAARLQAYQAERAQLRGAWGLSGRIAVSANGRGGSGRIDWTQTGERFDIALSAPVTRQSWRLSGDRGAARLDGLEGGPREGADAGELLQQAMGWTIPVGCLSDWVLGFSCGASSSLQETWDADGRPLSIQQLGWVIEYQDWHPAAAGQPALPRRIFARNTTAKATVRLVIDEWKPGDPAEAMSSAHFTNQPLRRALAALDLLHPEADMRLQVARGDRRAVGVCGESCSAPGLDPGLDPVRSLERELRLIEGTGDVHFGPEDSAMQGAAIEYATRYNRALAPWLAMSEAQRRQVRPPAADAGLPPGF